MKQRKVLSLLLLIIGAIAVGGFLLSRFQSSNEFGIYLAESNELVISDREVVSYNRTSHQIRLTDEGVERVKKMDLYHKTFVAKLSGKELYNGSFWSDMDSIPYKGVAIIDIALIQRGFTNTLRIDPCYPPTFCSDVDPRDNLELLEYFQRTGKLIE